VLALATVSCTDPPGDLSGSGPDAAPPDASVNCSPIQPTCELGSGCYWAGPGRFECATALGLPRYHVCRDSTDCSPGDGCHLDDIVDFYCVGYCDYGRYGGERDPDRCGENELCAGPLDGGIGQWGRTFSPARRVGICPMTRFPGPSAASPRRLACAAHQAPAGPVSTISDTPSSPSRAVPAVSTFDLSRYMGGRLTMIAATTVT